MDQSTHKRPRQRERLLALLRSRAPNWVSLAEILVVAGAQYGARVYELRGLGHRVESKPGGGWFRLIVRSTVDPSPSSISTPADSQADADQGLFPDDVPPRHLDLG
jgi:hypothetical protein